MKGFIFKKSKKSCKVISDPQLCPLLYITISITIFTFLNCPQKVMKMGWDRANTNVFISSLYRQRGGIKLREKELKIEFE